LDAESAHGAVGGTLITETLDYDGGRRVTVYVPAQRPEAIVFAGDGQLVAEWGDDVEAADGPSTMIVGVHRPADEALRLHEYSPSFDPARFAAHDNSSSRTSAAGRRRGSASHFPPTAPQCAAYRLAGSWPSHSGFDIQTLTARFCAPPPAPDTDRLQ
jgi:hypothetical protein